MKKKHKHKLTFFEIRIKRSHKNYTFFNIFINMNTSEEKKIQIKQVTKKGETR